MKFTEIINAIEAELNAEYLPECIQWCDANFENAWSNAIDRFDLALSISMNTGDRATAIAEGIDYKKTIIGLIKKYKEHAQLDDLDVFLKSLRKR